MCPISRSRRIRFRRRPATVVASDDPSGDLVAAGLTGSRGETDAFNLTMGGLRPMSSKKARTGRIRPGTKFVIGGSAAVLMMAGVSAAQASIPASNGVINAPLIGFGRRSCLWG